MMMLTNGEDRSLASKLYQQHHQAAPMAAPPGRQAPLDGVKGTQISMSSCAIRAGSSWSRSRSWHARDREVAGGAELPTLTFYVPSLKT